MRLVSALRRPRPLGVYVISFLLALRGLDVIEGVRIQRGGLTTLLFPSNADPAVLTAIGAAGATFVVIVVLGLLWLKRWALVTTTFLTGANLAFGLWIYWQGRPQYLSLLASVLIAFYLNQREVRQAFTPRERQHAGA